MENEEKVAGRLTVGDLISRVGAAQIALSTMPRQLPFGHRKQRALEAIKINVWKP